MPDIAIIHIWFIYIYIYISIYPHIVFTYMKVKLCYHKMPNSTIYCSIRWHNTHS